MPDEIAERIDGRRQRSQRSRERILDAIEAVLRDMDPAITPEHVASRAGMSLRTVFRHFGDVDGLSSAMRDRITERVAPLLEDRSFSGDLAARVGQIVRRRIAIFETIGPFVRTAQRMPIRASGDHESQLQLDVALDAQLDAALGAELAKPGRERTRSILAALLSFEAWSHFRVTQRVSAAEVPALLERAVTAILAAPPD